MKLRPKLLMLFFGGLTLEMVIYSAKPKGTKRNFWAFHEGKKWQVLSHFIFVYATASKLCPSPEAKDEVTENEEQCRKQMAPSKHRRPIDLGQTQTPGVLVLEGILEMQCSFYRYIS